MGYVKISELPIGSPNSTGIFPFVDSGTTYYGAISAITSNISGLIEITYSGLVDKITGGTLTSGQFYLITDFQTCYDQPDFDYNNNAILTGNYKETSVDPIIVFSTGLDTISTTAYQPSYPKDRIQYDWTFSETEITQGVAYGRISERIDEFNNRTDYDHRTIQFKRYRNIELDLRNPHNGTVIVGTTTGQEMLVSGTGTSFESFSVGQYVGFIDNDYKVYEITNIVSDTEMTITGLTLIEQYQVKIYPTNTKNYTSYKQNNISTTDYREYYTFNYQSTNLNNYIGNFSRYWYEVYFILANNVFLSGPYVDNKFGDGTFNNSIYSGAYDNLIGPSFYNNIFENGFYSNQIQVNCYNNRVSSNFYNNQIGTNFNYNYFVEYSIFNNFFGNYVYSNLLFNGNINDNKIGNNFSYNKIEDSFYENSIGNYFQTNSNYKVFNRNTISGLFSNNFIDSEFYENTIGDRFEYNTISGDSSFNDNQISNQFKGNYIFQEFSLNTTGSYIAGNHFSGYTRGNIIGDYTNNNDFLGSVVGNNWRSDFYNNVIGNEFNGNSFYFEIYSNVIGVNFNGNNIQSYFDNNIIGDGFQTNQIGNFFEGNTIGDNFGFGQSAPQGNKIGNNFYDNTVGESFYNNTISDNFGDNLIDNYFQWNIINTSINSTCLSTGMLYDTTTVNVFKNKNGDNRLSYYDELDVLTIETLTEAPCNDIVSLDIPENDLSFGLIL